MVNFCAVQSEKQDEGGLAIVFTLCLIPVLGKAEKLSDIKCELGKEQTKKEVVKEFNFQLGRGSPS